MNKNLLTNIAGFSGMASLFLDTAVQQGLISPAISPIAKAVQALAMAVIGYYVAKPVDAAKK